MIKLLPLFLISIVFTACSSNQKSAFFDPEEPFEIINIEKHDDTDSSYNYTDICAKWSLTSDEAKAVLEDSRVINNSELHYQFSFFKCQYIGQLNQANKTYKFSVNAGSWFTISNTDSTVRYGYFEDKYNSLFIDNAW